MSAKNTPPTSSVAPGGTEQQDPRYGDIDLWPVISVLDSLAEAQMTATAVARAAVPQMNDVVTAALRVCGPEGGCFTWAPERPAAWGFRMAWNSHPPSAGPPNASS